jgi:O-antigen/teichoic acid export membrane protein
MGTNEPVVEGQAGSPRPMGTNEPVVEGQAGHAVRGAAWLLGGQVAAILAQLLYAAFTGRMVAPAAFGAYAVAMSTAPLVLMLATAGIGSAAARASELTEQQVRALATVSLGLGVAAAGVVWLIAVPWSALWGNPQAADAIRWSALGIFPAPLLGLLAGLCRRSGKFRQLSMASTGGGFLGMTVGAAFVWHFRSAASLVTVSISATAVQTVLLGWVVGRAARPGPLRFDVIEHLRFGTKVVLSNGIGYLTAAAPQLALSRGVGASMLGSWNRSAAITQVPLEIIQNSLVQVLYPEFRHDIDTTDRASRLWLDLLALAAWVMLPLGAVTAACAYFAVPFVLGPGWQASASLAPWVAMTAAVNVPVVVLGSALEATGRFGGVWLPRIVGLVITASAASIALVSHSVGPVIVGLLAAAVVSHALQLRYVSRSAVFPVPMLLRVYLRVLLATAAVGLVTTFSLSAILVVESLAIKILLSSVMVLMAGTTMWFARLHLPPIRIARRYGLFKGLG